MSKLRHVVAKNARILSIVAGICICFYFVARVIVIAFPSYSAIDRVFGILLLIGETYILIHALGYLYNVFELSKVADKAGYSELNSDTLPDVAIVVAARHEPKTILQETFTTLSNIDYPKKNIYLLDDSSDDRFIQEANELEKEFNIHVFRRPERHGAKAGIVNDFLRTTTATYVAIFDADQNPMPGFLKKTIPLLENDKNLAFVQTPQFYTNMDISPIASGATFQQAIFYENICEGKNRNNAMFCCGTNVVFRVSALREVNGFDESSVTEDFATSLKLHQAQYKSLYFNHAYAFGMAPETLSAYFKQQSRWATGTIQVFRKLLINFIRRPLSLTPAQWWEYFLAGSYYFIGWSFFCLMVCPAAFLVLDIPSFFVKPSIYFASFLPYFLISLLIFYTTMSGRNYPLRQIYYGTILGLLSFPILMRSAVYGLLGKKVPFVITTKGQFESIPLSSLMPWILMIAVNLLALGFGVRKIYLFGMSIAVVINMFWVLYHTTILSHIFYFNRKPNS
ncbi:MAG: glycosyltransferase [Fibrobacteres bacterium]|nr:glycosyltransferase [Fibrobacterota bacterium]